ncbi:MAG: hemerythrin domain-containing protein [Planctomycetota bacterium]|nr:hemerythrin domain-containing protein [Planctomycetota bacterium]
MEGKSFLELLGIHESLLAMFGRHQEALVSGNLEAARSILERFDSEIREHIRLEDGTLIPIFEERAGAIPGGDPKLFQAEHRKIEAYLDEIRPATESLESGDARALIELLEREYLLKQLLMHHDLREKNILYPELDRVTNEAERSRLIHGSSPG